MQVNLLKVFVEKRKFIFGSKVRQASTTCSSLLTSVSRAGAGHSCCPLVAAHILFWLSVTDLQELRSPFPSQACCAMAAWVSFLILARF